MGKRGRIAAVIGLGLLGACTRWVDDPLAVRDVYWGLSPNPVYRGELPRVLYSAQEVPDKQGLLYTSMFDSEVASQYSGRALVATDPGGVHDALAETLYAIDPDTAPPREPNPTGIMSGWAGAGYGARRATAEMAIAIRDAVASDGSAALKQHGPEAAACADNTVQRADRVAALSRQALEAPTDEALLQETHDVAWQLLRGPNGGADPATCGLEQVKRDLDPLAPPTGTGY
jgi:hypothetical protein